MDYRLWAPLAGSVQIDLPGSAPMPMTAGSRGWWSHVGPGGEGTRYAYRLDGGEPLPDPAARALPDGVHAAAAVVDPSQWIWTDQQFRATPLSAAVIYELHIGTFTTEGTFEAAVDHLPGLVDLGVTHVEVMPVNAFDGEFGWGYDGVAWWAVHQPYGGPAAFAAFVDACHAVGLSVVLDVVHNHLGPSGNYLPRFGPYYQGEAESTWGKVINLDGPDSDPVRQFLTGNVEMWLEDFHVDALRLDAVHALDDRASATPILAEISAVAGAVATRTGRPRQLIAESDRNDPATITPRSLGGLGMDAQWADDLHHAIHVAVTGEVDGYYVDYADPLAAIERAFTNGLVYDGGWWSAFRRRTVGAPMPADRSSRQLIACIQNHDQVGNRAAGDRLTTLVEPAWSGWRSPCCAWHRTRRCCSWVRSTARPPPSSSSATCRGRTCGRPSATGDVQSSRGSRRGRGTCRTPSAGTPSSGPNFTGQRRRVGLGNSAGGCGPTCSRCVGRSRRWARGTGPWFSPTDFPDSMRSRSSVTHPGQETRSSRSLRTSPTS